MGDAPVEVRVGDRERRAVDEQLQAAVGDGVLTLAEYDERSGVLWQARTRADLDRLVADLPRQAPSAAPPATRGERSRPQRIVAVMSEDRFAAPVAPGQEVRGWAVMGKAVLDLRREDLPPGTHVRVRAVMGEVEVQVPPGSVVHLSGMALMGERKVEVAAGGGPAVHVDAYALMGAVKVTVGDGSVAPGAAVAQHQVRPHHGAVQHPGFVQHRRGVLARAAGGIAGIGLSGALVLGAIGVVASGTDGRAVFGSDDTVVTAQDDRVAVSVVFGSVQVVVEDGVRIDKDGLVVFGSVSCDDACAPDRKGKVVSLRSLGGFGSVEILTSEEVLAGEPEEPDD